MYFHGARVPIHALLLAQDCIGYSFRPCPIRCRNSLERRGYLVEEENLKGLKATSLISDVLVIQGYRITHAPTG